ncbi:hypothetical protein Acr_05g0012710 [Actinidia rufa]|uniref:Uncharacterized protein n=1 Tax=Actinidia rufa TaxID=165716 RepID=A0A7J0EMT9_9ERIC|nr:hypothetical protein Acr_05g0012710 [Actinidia rufa]
MAAAMAGSGRREEETNGIEEEEEEYAVDDLRDTIDSLRGRRLNLLKKELGFEPARRIFNRENVTNGINDLSKGMVIHPDNSIKISADGKYKRAAVSGTY